MFFALVFNYSCYNGERQLINYDRIRQLPIIGEPDDRIIASLINMTNEEMRYEFLWNPTQYSYSAQNTFATRYAMFARTPNTTFVNAQVGKLTINGLELRTPCGDRSMNEIARELESLRLPLSTFEDSIPGTVAPGTVAPGNVLTVPGTVEAPTIILEDSATLVRRSPPTLAFVYGSTVVQPLFIESLNIDFMDLLNGQATALVISVNFIGQNQLSL